MVLNKRQAVGALLAVSLAVLVPAHAVLAANPDPEYSYGGGCTLLTRAWVSGHAGYESDNYAQSGCAAGGSTGIRLESWFWRPGTGWTETVESSGNTDHALGYTYDYVGAAESWSSLTIPWSPYQVYGHSYAP